jgi:hypothetical protein
MWILMFLDHWYFYKSGNVLPAVNQNYKCELIHTDKIPNIDHIFVLLNINNIFLPLGCVYIPPNSPNETYFWFTDLAKDTIPIYLNANILIIGDFVKL